MNRYGAYLLRGAAVALAINQFIRVVSDAPSLPGSMFAMWFLLWLSSKIYKAPQPYRLVTLFSAVEPDEVAEAQEPSGYRHAGTMLADLAERHAQKGAIWYWSQVVLSLPAIVWGALRQMWDAVSRRRGA